MPILPFREALHTGPVLLMDGAMGTELQKRGLTEGMHAPDWNVDFPDRVRSVHAAYRAAGATVFLTNTFTALWDAPFRHKPQGLEGAKAIETTFRSALNLLLPGEAVYRFVSLGPVVGSGGPQEFHPLSTFTPHPDWFDGADGVLLETASSPRIRFAMQRVRRISHLPLLISLSFRHQSQGRGDRLVSASRHSPEWFATRARAWGADALGINCGCDITLEDALAILRAYQGATDLPLFLRPNAGTPRRTEQGWRYPLSPKALAERLPEFLALGVRMIGGCCGTTPEHIAALRARLEALDRGV